MHRYLKLNGAFLAITLLAVPGWCWNCAAQAPEFRFDREGSFTLLHITDIQDNDKPKERTLTLLSNLIDKYQPGLLVITGDNTAECNKKRLFERAIGPYIELFKTKKSHFAITFGNHDSRQKGVDFYTREEQYTIMKEMGGVYFVDYDVPHLSGCGTGVVPVKAHEGDQILFNIFVVDSGDYIRGEGDGHSNDGKTFSRWAKGWGGTKGDQIRWYEEVSGTTPCLWFQHIIVPDVYTNGLLVSVPERTPGAIRASGKFGGGEFAGFYLLNSKLSEGLLKEYPCPTLMAAYGDEEHTFEGRSLYMSWCKMGNMRGTFFGHDHTNTFDGEDQNKIRLGMTKAATTHSYNDGNPGARLFQIRASGNYTTRIVAESDFK